MLLLCFFLCIPLLARLAGIVGRKSAVSEYVEETTAVQGVSRDIFPSFVDGGDLNSVGPFNVSELPASDAVHDEATE